MKLEDWKAAVESATTSLEHLDKVISSATPSNKQDVPKETEAPATQAEGNDTVVEISGEDAEAEEKELKRLRDQDEQRTNVMRIRAKSLMRRAKAKSQMGGWASLQGAAEDYQALNEMEGLPSNEKRIVQRALLELPDRIKEAREKEMGEMISKMKDVSNVLSFCYPLSPQIANVCLSL